MTEENDDDGRLTSGVVKWFDPSKGFGFVLEEGGGEDILLHANVLRNFGQSSIADGSEISLRVQMSERGLQAIEVVSVTPPDIEIGAGLEDFVDIDPLILAAAPLEPARVKWFDKAKGFGFANIFGKDEDIFVHVEVLRKSGLADLQAGEAVGLRVIDGKRGRMASVVTSWETAVKLLREND